MGERIMNTFGKYNFNMTKSILIACRTEEVALLVRVRIEKIGFKGEIIIATTCKELLFILKKKKPDVMLLDALFYGAVTNFKILMLSQKFLIRIVIFSIVECELFDKVKFFRYGAESFVSITDGVDVYEEAIRRIISGERVIPKDVINGKWDLDILPPENLLLDEVDCAVLELTALGLNFKEIGNKIGLEERTISNRRTLIFDKLGAHNNFDMVHKGIQYNYIDKCKLFGCNASCCVEKHRIKCELEEVC
jgi:DNA-binding NarL/FixJ family response regulator